MFNTFTEMTHLDLLSNGGGYNALILLPLPPSFSPLPCLVQWAGGWELLGFPEALEDSGHQACHYGQHNEGDGACPQAGLVPLDVFQSLRGDRVGEVQHEAQCPPDVSVRCLR